jgi:cytochrome c-type biogenesis protein CcmE
MGFLAGASRLCYYSRTFVPSGVRHPPFLPVLSGVRSIRLNDIPDLGMAPPNDSNSELERPNQSAILRMSLFKDKSMKPKQLKFLVGSVAIVLVLIYLGYAGFKSSMSYNQTVSEMLATKDIAYGRHIELTGEVIPGTIKREGRVVIFDVNDSKEKEKIVTIRYEGKDPLPDTFRDNATAMAKGKLDKSGVFVATQMTAKCASKYEKEKAAGLNVDKAGLD